jgi:Uma2 family endonuclease
MPCGIASWVVNAVTLQARIHRDPTPTGYRTIVDLPPTERLEPLLEPSLAVTLAELELY